MRVVEGVSPRGLWRGVFLAAVVIGLAGCSSDTHRFSDNPFADRAQGPQADVTGSVPAQRAPVSRIESRPLHATQAPPPPAGSYNYGSRVATGGHAIAPAPRSATPSHVSSASGITHVVAPGETLMSLSRRYHRSLREIVSANQLTYDARLKVGDRIIIPGVSRPASASAAQPAPAPRTSQKVATAPRSQPAAPVQVATKNVPPPAQPQASARVASPAVELEQPKSTGGVDPQFRWPVRGRVISGYGPLPNGQHNDGVNLSVPEGTAIRAAEDGVVAYSGNELKGYGNLILLRHSNGFVTAYAHASELMVKRGDTVRRGQIIAKSGATGNVTAPQLHFEIRKGSAPVDPTRYLAGA
jgi:murein DD-endopeptidase MepM/ murein hydrolase activator NlpD